MTIFFVGGEDIDYGAAASPETAPSYQDPDFTRCAIYSTSGVGAGIEPRGYFWLHLCAKMNSHSSYGDSNWQNPLISLVDINEQAVFQITSPHSGLFFARHWNGTGWSEASELDTGNGLHNLDVCFDSGQGIRFYSDEALDYEVVNVSNAPVSYVELGRGGTGSITFSSLTSQIIIADEDTRGWRLMTIHPTSDGTHTEWTGGEAEIDEIELDVNDGIISSAAGQTSTVTGNKSLPSSYEVRAVAVSTWGSADATGPQNLAHVLDIDGTVYEGAPIPLGQAPKGQKTIFDVNPATNADWGSYDISQLEYGVRSKT